MLLIISIETVLRWLLREKYFRLDMADRFQSLKIKSGNISNIKYVVLTLSL